MPDDAVMCVACGKLIDGADAVINASEGRQGVTPSAGERGEKTAKSWIFSTVAFILYFSVQVLASVIPVIVGKLIVYCLFVAPILAMSILGMVASMKDYKKKEQRTFMFVMLLLSILFLVQALVSIISYVIGASFIGGLI